jgi:amino acid transporter
MSIWSRKSVALLRSEALESGAQHLRRTLGPIRLTAFGVGCTVGAGVFVLTGTVAAHHAGPAVSISFALAAAVCLIAGLCYAEFAALVPVAGSAYSYAYATLGELVAWLIGWTLMLEYMFSASLGSLYVHSQNWHPFIPPNSGVFGRFGWSGVMAGAGIVFFSYLGFDTVSTLAEETRNPQRTVPLSLFASLLICTLLYVGVSVVVTGLVKYSTLDVPDPLYSALAAAGSSVSWLKVIVAVTAILGLVSVILTCLIGQVRIFFAMEGQLGEDRGSSRATSFRTPFVPTLPLLGVISCLVLMYSLPNGTWVRLIVWLAVGVAIYAGYGHRHSRLRTGEISKGRAQRPSEEFPPLR